MGEVLGKGIELCSLRFGEERRRHERMRTKARFMLKVGLDHFSTAGFCIAVDVSPAGIQIIPDPIVFDIFHDFHQGRTVIMIGSESWNRKFSIAGHVVNVRVGDLKAGILVGISIASTSSQAFLNEWINKGKPEPR